MVQVNLLAGHQAPQALAYVIVNNVGGILAAAAGFYLMRGRLGPLPPTTAAVGGLASSAAVPDLIRAKGGLQPGVPVIPQASKLPPTPPPPHVGGRGSGH